MLCIMILCITAFLVYAGISDRTLTENYLSQAAQNLEHSCNELASELYTSYSIPDAIVGTSYYGYVRGITSGALPQKYYSILPYVSKALKNQQYLLKKSDECVLYLAGSNCIVTRNRVFPVAEDCFASYLGLESLSEEEIMLQLRRTNHVTLLPVQNVAIGNDETRRLPLIIRSVGSPITVMSFYSEETILNGLGLYHLPPNTHLQITGMDGTVLEAYPRPICADVQQESYELQGQLPHLRATVTVWIDRSYFFEQTIGARRAGWMLIGAMFSVGLALCVVLSRVAATPVRQLFLTHVPPSHSRKTNEIHALSNVLVQSKNQIETLRDMLFSNLLTRVFSGSVLSKEDERNLAGRLQAIAPHYRAAIIHASSENDLLSLLEQIPLQSSGPYCAAVLNTRELGLLASDETGWLDHLREICRANPYLICGLSLPCSKFQNIYDAAKQARHALSYGPGTNVYHVERADASCWLQHERLFQSIVANDPAACLQILNAIKEEKVLQNARENFYHISFVMRNAALERNLTFTALDGFEYDPTLLPQENVDRLIECARLLFEQMHTLELLDQSSRRSQLLRWISKNYADWNLCAATAAEFFGLSEKSIYTMVRQSTGLTFNEYLLSVRMKQIGLQLCSTRDSVAEIARRCGYPTESTFYRLFKKYYGCSPLQYRQNGDHRVHAGNAGGDPL